MWLGYVKALQQAHTAFGEGAVWAGIEGIQCCAGGWAVREQAQS